MGDDKRTAIMDSGGGNGGKKTCLECRIVGSCTLGSITLYAIHLHRKTPRIDRVQRIFLGGIAIGKSDILINSPG